MEIKFPQNIDGYTLGKLWRDGVDEGVARRLLFSLNEVDDEEEMAKRKLYLAYFYYSREDYDLAANLCRQLVLEEYELKNALTLLQHCSMKYNDYIGLSETIMAVKSLFPDDNAWFVENVDESELADPTDNPEMRRKDVNVEYKDGWVEYYKNGKMVFKHFDNDYGAFNKDNEARLLLKNGKAEEALDVLNSINLKFLKKDTLMLCKQSYVAVYAAMGDWMKAYAECEFFFKDDLYMSEMLQIMVGLKLEKREEEFNRLRDYLLTLKGYEIDHMTDFFAYSETFGDRKFWEKLIEDNPLSKLRESDERLCLEGCVHESDGEGEEAEKCWKRSVAIYGQFSKAKYYLEYPQIYREGLKRLKAMYPKIRSFSSYLDKEHFDLCVQILMEKMTRPLKDGENKRLCINEKLGAFGIAMSDMDVDVKNLSENINKLYKQGLLPARSEILRYAVNYEEGAINRAICFANYLMYSGKKYVFFNGELRENLILELKGNNEQVKYGVAIFLSHCFVAFEANGDNLRRLYLETKKVYNAVDWDKYKGIKAYTVYIFFLRYLTGERIPKERLNREIINDMEPFRDAFYNASMQDGVNQNKLAKIATVLESMRVCY